MTFSGTFDELAATIIETAESMPLSTGPKVISIGGYPLTGKTRLSINVAAKWRYESFVLQTETVIAARRDRMTAGHNGSSNAAHDVQALVEFIAQLRCQESIVVPLYSWQTGSFEGVIESPALDAEGLVVLDGSIATAYPVRTHADAAFALKPVPLDSWLQQAVERDVTERGWDVDLARVQNVAKAATVEDQLTDFGSELTQRIITVRVDSHIWLAADDLA